MLQEAVEQTNSQIASAGGGVVGFCGSLYRPARSRTLVEVTAERIAKRYGLHSEIYDLADMFPDIGAATNSNVSERVLRVITAVRRADILVVGTPVYKGSYSGLFKHFFDLLEPAALSGLPVVLTATGGGERHALVVEHQLRPLFAFFTAHCTANAIYASTNDFADGSLVSEAISQRIDCAINDLSPWLVNKKAMKT